MTPDLIVRGHRIFVPEGPTSASLHISNGVIDDILDFDQVTTSAPVVDAGALAIIPGIVDTHVHVNEPGRSEWEGFDSATRAAAAGGITTLIDMPLNSVPATTSVNALTLKRKAAAGKCHVDVGFWGGVVPGNANQIAPLIDAGVRGFKCFMTPSGVDEFQAVTIEGLEQALSQLAATSVRVPLLVHAEDPVKLRLAHGDPRAYLTFLDTRPPEAEVAAIGAMAGLAQQFAVPIHIVHVSSSEAAAAVADAQAAGISMTAETCPHYLTFSAAEIADGATEFKCAPPIRDARHRDALWRALKTGVCTMVASDHSPAPRAVKHSESGDFLAAWGGIASLELSLRAVWTGARDRGFGLGDLVAWMSANTAALCGLGSRKGAIRRGYDADLVLFNPDAEATVESSALHHRHKLTPYHARTLRGAIEATFVRGIKVSHQGRLVQTGQGCLL